MVSITIESLRKKLSRAPDLPYTIAVPDPDVMTIKDVKKLLSVKFKKFPVERQRLTLPPNSSTPDAKARAPKDEETIAQAGLKEGGTLQLKDLGPQASWTTVFIIEYAGPLLVHFLVFNYFPWDVPFVKSKMQYFAYWLFQLHFLKRELETIFVHRFSHATMPAFNILRNSAHYWLLSGLMSAVSIYGPWNSYLRVHDSGSWRDQDWYLWTCTAGWAIMELLNLHSHWTLRNLRPSGTTARGIPRGGAFDFFRVSCANYTTEVIGWLFVCALTQDMWCMIYVLISTGTMARWALARHKKYRKESGDAYPKRKAIFPGIL